MKITPLGKTLSFSYDNLKHLDKVTVPGVYAREYDYATLSGNRSSNLVSRVDYTQNGSTYFSRLYYDYVYDKAGNITTVKQNGSQIAKYGYDEQGQLLTETRGGTTYRYVYDTAGNILEVIPSGLPASESYTYSTGVWKDQLTSIKIGGTTKSISYDASGNPTNWFNGNTLTNLEWSKGRQLTKLNKDSTVIEYAYDMSGIRSSKKVGSDTYHYITQNGQVVRQTWGSKILDIVYDNNGQPFAMCYSTDSGKSFTDYYYITNVQGDVVRLVNSAGTTVANYTYDAWGKVLSVKNASGTTITSPTNIANINPIRYRGYYYDTETGWYYLQSRYYDPEIGRFINADELVSTGQGFIGHNMFAYCLNNPVNYTDVNGLIAISATMGITLAILLEIMKVVVTAAVIVLVLAIVEEAYKYAKNNSNFSMPKMKAASNTSTASPPNGNKNNRGSRRSDKEKSTDKPSWVNRSDVNPSQSAQQNARRLMYEKYGDTPWDKNMYREFSEIVKWIQRSVFFYDFYD